ncbi:unnamed protein product [Sphagnum balticum]
MQNAFKSKAPATPTVTGRRRTRSSAVSNVSNANNTYRATTPRTRMRSSALERRGSFAPGTINVTSLGLFSSGSAISVPSGESIRVQIFQRTSSDSDILQSNTAIADLFFTSSSTVTLFSGFLYQSLTPVTLNPGSFTCVASGFDLVSVMEAINLEIKSYKTQEMD